MKLERWAHIAEITSGIAIVVTIIVLIFEVRTNNSLLERQLNMERIERSEGIFESEHLPRIFGQMREVEPGIASNQAQVFMERFGLSFPDADRVTRYYRTIWQSFEADFTSGNTYPRMERTIQRFLRLPDHALYWDSGMTNRDPEFVDFVESLDPRPNE